MASIYEASSHDQINMTKIWLEYDQNVLQQQIFTIEHDWKIYNDER